jgi:MFS family permease
MPMRLITEQLAMIGGPFARAMLAAFFFFGSLNGFVLLPLYIHQLGGSEAAIGVVQGLYSATGILCQPLVGAWVDRLGRRRFMLGGSAILVVATAAFIVSSSIPVLAVLRALHGVAFSAFFVSNYLYVVDLVPPERRGWALGIFGVSGLISTSLAPLLGEFLVRHWGFGALFGFSTVLAVAATAVAERVRETRPRILGVGPTADVFRDSLREVWRLHMGLMLCFGLGTGTIFTFLPTFGEHLGVRGLGLFYTAYAVAAMLVRLVGGQLIDLRGPRAVIIPSMAVQVGAALVLALVALFISPAARVPVLPFLFLAGFLAGGAHGFLYPALSALLVDVTPENRRARAVGTFSSVFLFGNAVGAMAFGYVAAAFGYRATWSALALLLCLGFLSSLRLRVGAPRTIAPGA